MLGAPLNLIKLDMGVGVRNKNRNIWSAAQTCSLFQQYQMNPLEKMRRCSCTGLLCLPGYYIFQVGTVEPTEKILNG